MATIYLRIRCERQGDKMIRFHVLLSLALLLLAAPARAEDMRLPASGTPAEFVQRLGDIALQSLTDKGTPAAEREQRVRSILENYFDIQTIGRFAMGPHWRDASDMQRQEYLGLFEDSLVRTYTRRFEDYSGQVLRVGAFTPSGDNDYLVSSQVVQQDGPPVNLEWRVRQKPDGLKIVDVVVEGISMSVTQRADFSSVIQRGSDSVDALLVCLREQKRANARKT